MDNQINVLAVDDESAILEMIRFALGKAGMNVFCAANAQEALNSINEQQPDIVLLDWMMPNLSGPALTRRLRKHPVNADIPIIMLTARSEESDKLIGLELGADDYITKPYNEDILSQKIINYIVNSLL